jgi:hypothetical protein
MKVYGVRKRVGCEGGVACGKLLHLFSEKVTFDTCSRFA